jgi:hypothetical protein
MKQGFPLSLLKTDHAKLKEIAKEEGVTMNALINRWIKDRLKRVK